MTVAENITKLVLEDKRLWQTMLATYGAFRQVDDARLTTKQNGTEV